MAKKMIVYTNIGANKKRKSVSKNKKISDAT
jgi:hypothetical protein